MDKMSTQTMFEEIMQPHTTLPPLGHKIFDALEKQQVPVKVLPGTTAFTLGDIIIQSPYREDTCICYPGSNDIAQLEYVRALLRDVRRDLHTQKMVELAKLPSKRAEEESKKLDVRTFLQRRSEEQQIRRIRVEIDKYRDDYDNASETSDTPHWGLPPPQEREELLLEDQGPAEPMATEKNEEDEDEKAEKAQKVEKDEEDEENKERDFRDSKLLPMEGLQLAVSENDER